MGGALSHLKILDLSRILAGPWATQQLADLGADVIKVERPEAGDDTRLWGPPFLKDKDGQETKDSAYYLCCNRNKRSVTIDFTKPEGQELVRELAARSDVLVENFKVGGLRQYGLDYEAIHKLNPRLVYCSITGFGQTGPYAQRAGYDFLIQGMGGLMSVTGHRDGEEGAGPMKVGVALTDILTALFASTAILAAVTQRDVSGKGQQIDLSLLDVQISCLANQAMNYLYTGISPKRIGNAHPNIVPYQDFPTSDGHMILAIGNDGQFVKFCITAGHPEWATDPRYATSAARVINRNTLIAAMRQVTLTRPTAEWVECFEAIGVPCGPINTIAQVFEDLHVKAHGTAISMSHPLGGQIPLVANPIRLSETPIEYRMAPPMLGQHTREVLRDVLGLDEQRIADLRQRKVV